MLNKKIIFIFSIILLISLEIIIKYSLSFYNKKFQINFSINNFKEHSFLIDDSKSISYYEANISRGEEFPCKTLVFLHNIFESSLNSKRSLTNTFDIENVKNYNVKIVLIDLPAHGKSFKEDNYDYSYRNISSCILKLLETLKVKDICLICDKLSSNIGLNMICLNDKIFSDLILINPTYKHSPRLHNLILSIKNKFLPIINLCLFCKNKDTKHLENYKISYFNKQHSSNKYVKRILKESTPIYSEKILCENIKLSFIITNPKSFNTSYLNHLSNNFSSIFFMPKGNLINSIIKK